MVIDTSALIAIMNNEPERRRFNELIEATRERSANEELLADCMPPRLKPAGGAIS